MDLPGYVSETSVSFNMLPGSSMYYAANSPGPYTKPLPKA